MATTLNPEIREVINAVHYRPALSIILPLEFHVNLKKEFAHTLKVTTDKAEAELHRYYPDDLCQLIASKLHNLIATLEIPAKKKGRSGTGK